MKRAEQIEHRGVVAHIDGDCVRVEMEVNEACGGCSARSSCAMGTSTKRDIIIYTDEASSYSVGEVVNVAARQSMGVMAVVLCYVLPLVVLVMVLAVAVAVVGDELIAALLSLGVTALYYGVLYLFQDRIAKKVVFTINKI